MWTDKEIKAMKPEENQARPKDIREKSKNGFAITIFPSGEKSFIYLYHFEGRKRRMTLGKYPHCTLQEARSLHRDAVKMLHSGKDPAFEKQQKKLNAREASTVEGLIDEYIKLWAIPRKRSWKEDLRCLNKELRLKVVYGQKRSGSLSL